MLTTCVKEKNGDLFFYRGEGPVSREVQQWERWQGSNDPKDSNFYFLKSDGYTANEVFEVKTQLIFQERYGKPVF